MHIADQNSDQRWDCGEGGVFNEEGSGGRAFDRHAAIRLFHCCVHILIISRSSLNIIVTLIK